MVSNRTGRELFRENKMISEDSGFEEFVVVDMISVIGEMNISQSIEGIIECSDRAVSLSNERSV